MLRHCGITDKTILKEVFVSTVIRDSVREGYYLLHTIMALGHVLSIYYCIGTVFV